MSGDPWLSGFWRPGEHVVDVPAKLAAGIRLFDTGHSRKTDAGNAHSIAIVAVGTSTLRELQVDGELEALQIAEFPGSDTAAGLAGDVTWPDSCPHGLGLAGGHVAFGLSRELSIEHTPNDAESMRFSRPPVAYSFSVYRPNAANERHGVALALADLLGPTRGWTPTPSSKTL